MSMGNYGFKLPSGRFVTTFQYRDMDPDRWGRRLAAEAVGNRQNTADLLDHAEPVGHCPSFGAECPAGCGILGRRFDMSPHFGLDGRALDRSVLDCPGFHLQFHYVAANNQVGHLGWEDVTLEMTEEDLIFEPSFSSLAYRAEVARPCEEPSYQYIWDLGHNLFHIYHGADLEVSFSLNHPASLSQLAGWAKASTFSAG